MSMMNKKNLYKIMLDKHEIIKKYLDINRTWKQITSVELNEIMKDKSIWDDYQELRKLFNIEKKRMEKKSRKRL
jgi:hypothetical protein